MATEVEAEMMANLTDASNNVYATVNSASYEQSKWSLCPNNKHIPGIRGKNISCQYKQIVSLLRGL